MHDRLTPFDTALTTALARWGMTIDAGCLDRLRAHFRAVLETNRTMNLTRITEPIEAAVKHYADSLAALTWVENRNIAVRTVLDVGTGAGFPAVPLALMRPDWSVTAIDATAKKIDFLRRTAAAIGLTNLACEHAHSLHWERSTAGKVGQVEVRDLPQGARRSRQVSPGSTCPTGFDLVIFRALGTLAKSLEQTAGYVARDGWLVAQKTDSVDSAEQRAADLAAPKLRLRLIERYAYDLELESETIRRALYVYRKSI